MRKTAAIGLLVVITITIAACDDDTDASQPTSTSSKKLTTPNGVEEHKKEPTPGVGPESTSPLTQAQIQQALLTLEDMPQGWTPVQSEDGGELSDLPGVESTNSISPQECVKLVEQLDGENPIQSTAWAGAEFEADTPEVSQFLAEKISLRTVGTSPQDYVETFTNLVNTCPEIVDETKPTDTLKLSTLETFPQLGDASVSVRLTIEGGSISLPLDLVYIARGEYLISLSSTALSTDDTQPHEMAIMETEQLGELAVRAIEKFDATREAAQNPSEEEELRQTIEETLLMYTNDIEGGDICELLRQDGIDSAVTEVQDYSIAQQQSFDPVVAQELLLEYCDLAG